MSAGATAAAEQGNTLALRDPGKVMRLARMGAFHQTRLSFMRTLLRRIRREHWQIDRTKWQIDADGVGVAVYRIDTSRADYSLIAFSHQIEPQDRTDRVIAERWDATFTLMRGQPSSTDLQRLAANVPLQEAGRFSNRELILSRANKSVRMFDHVVERLAAGEQPDAAQIESVGYLMRTTAVYGNGKFGIADREITASEQAFRAPFQAEMLTVWIIRSFTVDLAESIAAARSPQTAVRLEPDLRRQLGVGNSTGLGMAPFLVNHPSLLHSWMHTRETALAIVRSQQHATPQTIEHFRETLARAMHQVHGWHTDDQHQQARHAALTADLQCIRSRIDDRALDATNPWDKLYGWAESTLSLEGQEMLVSLIIEPHGDLVDDLTDELSVDESRTFRIDGSMPVAALKRVLERDYCWALDTDFQPPTSTARFWYVSEEKLEPRLGERASEAGAELEQPLATGRDICLLYQALDNTADDRPLADFLLAHPQYRHSVRRALILMRYPYSEIRDNLIAHDVRPTDILRCKLSFFGATRFDPRSDRWIRITMFKGAPFADELAHQADDDWAFPPVST